MTETIRNFIIQSIATLTLPFLFFWMFLYPIYLKKKKDGRVDPNKHFIQNVWDSVLP